MVEYSRIVSRKWFTDRLYMLVNQYSLILIACLVFIFTAVLYLSIAPNRLTNANFGSDGGDFLSAILTHGVPHPTGYPTYVLLGSIFQALPFSTAVFRGVLESAIPAAVGAGLLTAWVVYVLGSKSATSLAAAVVTGVAWGIAPLLYSQAVIVEVHGLQSLFAVVGLWWVTINLRLETETEKRWVFGLALATGLGLGNHLTILLIMPAAIAALIIAYRQTRSWKIIVLQLVLLLAGTLVYVYLPVSAKNYPPINWGNPQTWAGFLWEVTGNPYRGLLFSTPASTVVERISSVGRLLYDQYGPVALVAGVIGAVQVSLTTKWLRWVLVWIFVVYFVFSIGYNTQDSVGYLLPALIIFVIWIGLAVPVLQPIRWKRFPVGSVLIGVLALSLVVKLPGTIQRVDAREQDQPARFAEQILKEAPANAIVETQTDQDTFPIWYYHFGLGQRTDLRIVVLSLTQFVWYQETLVHTYPDLNYPALYTQDLPSADWGKQIKDLNSARPVCTTTLSDDADTGVAFVCTSR